MNGLEKFLDFLFSAGGIALAIVGIIVHIIILNIIFGVINNISKRNDAKTRVKLYSSLGFERKDGKFWVTKKIDLKYCSYYYCMNYDGDFGILINKDNHLKFIADKYISTDCVVKFLQEHNEDSVYSIFRAED